MWIFIFSVSNSLSLLCLDDNICLLKLRSLISMSNSVPARECVIWDAERVLILETNFVIHIKKKIWKSHLYTVKCVHITCSYAVVCFVMNIILLFTSHPAQGRSLLTTLLSTYASLSLKNDDRAADGNGQGTKATDSFITD